MFICDIHFVKTALRDAVRGGWKTHAKFSDNHNVGPLRFNQTGTNSFWNT